MSCARIINTGTFLGRIVPEVLNALDALRTGILKKQVRSVLFKNQITDAICTDTTLGLLRSSHERAPTQSKIPCIVKCILKYLNEKGATLTAARAAIYPSSQSGTTATESFCTYGTPTSTSGTMESPSGMLASPPGSLDSLFGSPDGTSGTSASGTEIWATQQ